MKAAVYAAALLTLAASAKAQDSFKVSDHFSPTANPAVQQLAYKILHEKRVISQMDKVSHIIDISAPNHPDDHDDITLGITLHPGGKPKLLMSAVHCSYSWIFMERAEFRIGGEVVTLEATKPSTDVLESAQVFECVSWVTNAKEVQTVVKAIAAGKCTLCALRGTKGDRLATMHAEDFSNILTVYFALGGEPLNL